MGAAPLTNNAADQSADPELNADDAGGPPLATLLLWVGLIRLVILIVGLISIQYAPVATTPVFQLSHPWVAWDAADYYQIAQDGYAQHTSDPLFYHVGYFPLLPLIGRVFAPIVPMGVTMLLFSNLCSMIGFGFLYDWARRMTKPRIATVCVLLVATFPGAVSFAAGMTDGPFFMMVSIAFWLLLDERFYFAAIVTGVSTFTRPTGVALAICVLLTIWNAQKPLPLRQRLVSIALLGTISFSGLIGYELFLWQRFGSPTAYFLAQSHWSFTDQQRVQRDATHGLVRYSAQFFKDRLTRPQTWNRAFAAVFLVVAAIAYWKPGPVPRRLLLLPIIIFAMTAIPGHGLRISSIPRYESGAIPLFLLVAVWLKPPRRSLVVGGLLMAFLAIQIFYAYLFPQQIWVG